MERERENEEEMKREWGNGQRMRKWKEIHSLQFTFPYFLFFSSLSIHFLNKKLSHFVAKSKIWLWENNSGSDSLRESSASCEGLSVKLHSKSSKKSLLTGWHLELFGRNQLKTTPCIKAFWPLHQDYRRSLNTFRGLILKEMKTTWHHLGLGTTWTKLITTKNNLETNCDNLRNILRILWQLWDNFGTTLRQHFITFGSLWDNLKRL